MGWLELYPQLLGEAWRPLPEPVRFCHDADPSLAAVGRFQVTRATSWPARLALALAGMPAAGEDVALRLEVHANDDHQVWSRDFAGFTMKTTQHLLSDGRMAERKGALELLFQVTVEDEAIVYRPAGVRIRLGFLRVPLPSWLGPRVSARAWCEPGDTRMHVRITVAVLLLGTLITYGGPLARV